MATLKFHKVTSLPGTLEADAFYYVASGTYAESYITDSAGTAKSIGNSGMIAAVAGPLITSALNDFNSLVIVQTIAARNALSLQRNAMVLVSDATGDTTVGAGAALYVFNEATTSFSKIAEYENMDVTLQWANIQGRPSSSPSQIDDAVNKRHAHSNMAQLDKIGETNGRMTYNGADVSTAWETTNW